MMKYKQNMPYEKLHNFIKQCENNKIFKYTILGERGRGVKITYI
jgi:hypothetical protein